MLRIRFLGLGLTLCLAGVFGCGDSEPKVERGKNPFQERNEAYKEMHKEKGKGKIQGGVMD